MFSDKWRLAWLAIGVAAIWLPAIGWAQNGNDGGSNNGGNNNAGVNVATTVQLPTFGISVDADGLLAAKLFREPNQRLIQTRLAAAKGAKPGELWAAAKLRHVSLRRLEQAWETASDAGREPSDEVRHLAGLTRIQYVFCYPPHDGQPGDIILAGPAEPWVDDPAGRVLGLRSGRPTLLLEDLVVALRAYPPDSRNRPFVGCTIDPPAAGLARLVEFQKTIPRSIRDDERPAAAQMIGKGIADALGLANVRVFGVSPKTHFAMVLVEADYRMKRIAIGAEPPPIRMTTFATALQSPQQASLQRWWFTPNYQCLRVAPDRLAVEMVGEGVQLQTEDKVIRPDGTIAATGGTKNLASEAFVASFTKKYPDIAAASPIYAQLRGCIDLAVAAALIRRLDFYRQADWQADILCDEQRCRTETYIAPERVPCVVNSFWKGSRLFVPAGGGVSILPDQALEAKNLLPDEQNQVGKLRTASSDAIPANAWWWD
jgi:hypothetical protein